MVVSYSKGISPTNNLQDRALSLLYFQNCYFDITASLILHMCREMHKNLGKDHVKMSEK